jgi:hypothetical protein
VRAAWQSGAAARQQLLYLIGAVAGRYTGINEKPIQQAMLYCRQPEFVYAMP